MEPPTGCWPSFWNFLRFLPYFAGLLLLGAVKGAILCPVICVISTLGHAAVIVVLWPVHVVWTLYSVLRAKRLGPVLKLLLFVCLPAPLVLWPIFGIAVSCAGGLLYGFLSPIFATFHAVGEGKSDELFHCFYDGTWDAVTSCCTFIRDFKDLCTFAYFSYMKDLRRDAPDVPYHEISLLRLPAAITACLLGVPVDFFMISLIAICKSPYMLLKGWNRLFHDLVGREGPFLETICVPFAGLAILLWPLAVGGALLASVLSSVFLGAYAGVVAYQERSLRLGLCYIAASLSIFDEYSNDILDLPEGSCFPRPVYRRNKDTLISSSFSSNMSRFASVKNESVRGQYIIDLKSFEALDLLFKECRTAGDAFISEGLITKQDIDGNSAVVSVGLPAYCLLQCLLRSAKSNVSGLLLKMGDDYTEISTSNRPKDAFFDWFLTPFLILKEQIKAADLSEDEEEYFNRLALLLSDPLRFKSSNVGQPLLPERRQAELDGLARRLHGLVKSMSRYPTSRRHFENLVKNLGNELAKKETPRAMYRSKSAFARIFSQKSFKGKKSTNSTEHDEDLVREATAENV